MRTPFGGSGRWAAGPRPEIKEGIAPTLDDVKREAADLIEERIGSGQSRAVSLLHLSLTKRSPVHPLLTVWLLWMQMTDSHSRWRPDTASGLRRFDFGSKYEPP